MLTTPAAARLLAATTSLDAVSALGAALGFDAPLPLDRSTARQLGVPRTSRPARVAAGRGLLRLLSCEFDAEARQRTGEAARAIVRSAPHHSWLVIARDAATHEVFIAAPQPSGVGAVPAIEIDPARVRESDAETLATMAGASAGAAASSDLMVHLRWRETLGRDALTRRFYRELETQVSGMADTAVGRAPAEARRTIALLHASRLLFLAFLEARGWLDGDREFLRTQFIARSGGRGAHQRFLEPLWFGTLNTPWRARAATARAFGRVPFLNGGLFTRSPIEARYRELRLTDDAISGMIGGLLSRYRLTARESSDAWSDAAVDPEMLGRAFESLMHEGTRRAQGAFYTPPALITRLGRDGIVATLVPRGVRADALEALWAGEQVSSATRESLRGALGIRQAGNASDSLPAPATHSALRILDPACGSGAFLVFALEELARLREVAGDTRDVAARRRDVLTQSIFGVDVDPTAVWLCQLRLWLSVVVDEPHEDPTRVAPLPNLDRNVREGDALVGLGFDDARPDTDSAIAARRLRYARASGVRKRTLGAALAREERARVLRMLTAQLESLNAQRRDLIAAARSPDLFARTRGADRATRNALDELRAQVRRLRARIDALRNGAALPFSFATHFADAAADGGFDLVIGNPPWVRTHAIPADQRAALRDRFVVFKSAAWESGAASAAVGKGFAGQADLAALFTERAVRLATNTGAIALLLPAKLWGSLAGGGVRRLLATQAPPLILEDWSGSSAGFDAVVYPSALVARRGAQSAPDVLTTVHRESQPLTFLTTRSRLALDDTPGAPWLLLPTEVRESFDCLERAGVPLASSALGRPLLGVKSGCNEAFVLTREEAASARIEDDCLRPLLRGEHLQPWQATAGASESAILWTHDIRGEPLNALPAATHRRLLPWRRQLEQRTDGRGGRWWALFRTEAARADQPRVIWGDIGRAPRALVLRAGDLTVPLNTCYVVRTRSEDAAYAFAVLLNSPVGAAWLGALAEPARGGYRRFLGWTCARFPIPRDWDRACALLAPIGREASDGRVADPWTLTERVLEAYNVSHEAMAPLLSWHGL